MSCARRRVVAGVSSGMFFFVSSNCKAGLARSRSPRTSMCLNVLIMYLKVGRRGKEHTALLLLHDDVVYYITLYHRRRLGPITNFR